MTKVFLILAAAMVAGLAYWMLAAPKRLPPDELAARLAVPAPPVAGPVPVYHLGHSLVGRDMPAMLAQLAGHEYASQLGWGASLNQHWAGDVPGFAEENASVAFRAAGEALDSGDYGAVVLTEMVELKDAIRYHDSAAALARWAGRARAANADVRLYLYETWHHTDDPAGWEARIAEDGPALWQGVLLAEAMAEDGVGNIYVIPGGPALAAVAARIEAGEVPGMASRDDLFSDTIHLSDWGNYVIALAHYAVIYHRSPVGLPHDVMRADGTPIRPLSPEAALALQEVVWRAVSGYPFTGVVER
ncbi:MAG: hypothetical protein ACRC6I_03335 [Paracoccaceae bacterium]